MSASLPVPEWFDSSRTDPDTGDVKAGSDCEDTPGTRGTATVVMVAAGRVHASGASTKLVAESNAPAEHLIRMKCLPERGCDQQHRVQGFQSQQHGGHTQSTELFKSAPHHRIEKQALLKMSHCLIVPIG